jgi:membrane-associated phospholipid phosphatase
MGLHYLSDIVAGTLLGILVALIGLQIYTPLFHWVFQLLGFSLW